jgi:hypothetical protein
MSNNPLVEAVLALADAEDLAESGPDTTPDTTVQTAPESIPARIDRLFRLREEKRALDAQSKELENEIEALRGPLIVEMEAQGFHSVRAGSATATISKSTVPNVEDWDELNAYIVGNNALHLLQRRPAVGAFRELFEAGEAVPGVVPHTKWDLSLTKVTR